MFVAQGVLKQGISRNLLGSDGNCDSSAWAFDLGRTLDIVDIIDSLSPFSPSTHLETALAHHLVAITDRGEAADVRDPLAVEAADVFVFVTVLKEAFNIDGSPDVIVDTLDTIALNSAIIPVIERVPKPHEPSGIVVGADVPNIPITAT